MHYHIILTEKCNLKCKYCQEKSLNEFENGLEKKFTFDFSEPCTSNIDLKKLKSFLEKDENPVLIFYGGEPLLQIEKIKQIIDILSPKTTNHHPTPTAPKGVAFRMQTNGILLDKLEPKYLNKITKILISIDGDEQRTDSNRGKGTYKKIIQNISLMKKKNYKGELIARMTISQENPDIYDQVLHLMNLRVTNNQQPTTNNSRIFDSAHWQLDVGFYKTDFEENKIKNFLSEYNKQITRLIKYWTEEISKGNLINLYPFTQITHDLILQKTRNRPSRVMSEEDQQPTTTLRCGAGEHGYTITTSGKVVACPIMNSIKEFEAGTLDTNPKDLKKFSILDRTPDTEDRRPDCKNCKIFTICGGRCLYWRKTKLWPPEGDELICNSIKHLIKELKNNLPKINPKLLEHEKYFGPEIIP